MQSSWRSTHREHEGLWLLEGCLVRVLREDAAWCQVHVMQQGWRTGGVAGVPRGCELIAVGQQPWVEAELLC